jgi:para-aminobenzoate synthetase component 1
MEKLREAPFFWWLDSAQVGPRLGRYSYAGADPYMVVRGFGERIELDVRRAVRPDLQPGRSVLRDRPLDSLQGLLPPPPSTGEDPYFPFLGGAVGYFGYELAAGFEPVALRALDDLGLPDLCWLFVDRLFAFDHMEGRIRSIGLGFAPDADAARERAERAAARPLPQAAPRPLRNLAQDGQRRTGVETRRWQGTVPEAVAALRRGERNAASGDGSASGRVVPLSGQTPRSRAAAGGGSSGFDEASYGKAIVRAKEHIEAGDVYQVCLTRRCDVPFAGDPWRLYQRLRKLNPAPFAAYLALGDVTLLSCSPERFLSLSSERWVESRPIKGTRPRGDDPVSDRDEREALRRSEKDRAENLMIVDLVRNDLGRVCETGSVHVPELMRIEPYATVFQMVSTVRGRLRSDRGAFDLVRAAFPPGSMTGAPKLAAMAILDRLEPVRRAIYSGALGFLDLRGGAGLSVVIRSLFLKDGRAYVHSGGGIVADSRPAAEWRETEDKVRVLLAAIAAASE